jgi:hypothetical protein
LLQFYSKYSIGFYVFRFFFSPWFFYFQDPPFSFMISSPFKAPK